VKQLHQACTFSGRCSHIMDWKACRGIVNCHPLSLFRRTPLSVNVVNNFERPRGRTFAINNRRVRLVGGRQKNWCEIL
jgi:hypothetical protein